MSAFGFQQGPGGYTYRDNGLAAAQYIQEHGKNVTFYEVREHIKSLGMSLSEATFVNIYKQVFQCTPKQGREGKILGASAGVGERLKAMIQAAGPAADITAIENTLAKEEMFFSRARFYQIYEEVFGYTKREWMRRQKQDRIVNRTSSSFEPIDISNFRIGGASTIKDDVVPDQKEPVVITETPPTHKDVLTEKNPDLLGEPIPMEEIVVTKTEKEVKERFKPEVAKKILSVPDDDEDDEDDDDWDNNCPVGFSHRADEMSLFTRFALVVEAVGGPQKARELLNEMERVHKILGRKKK